MLAQIEILHFLHWFFMTLMFKNVVLKRFSAGCALCVASGQVSASLGEEVSGHRQEQLALIVPKIGWGPTPLST